MAALPAPEPGLVISYAYLWSEEAEHGRTEGRKDRPCAIVVAVEHSSPENSRFQQVAVVPITHSLPRDLSVAIEMPRGVKKHLGLDEDRSWIILDEVNVFTWPGYDLRPINRHDERIAYGLLPPKLFDQIIREFTLLYDTGRTAEISRDE